MLTNRNFTKIITSLVLTMILITASFFSAVPTNAFTSSDADTAMNAYNNAFYSVNNGKGVYKISTTNSGTSDFWKSAEMMEVIIDAYERTSSTTYKNMIGELYNGFIDKYGSNWTGNMYNDDIMWMVIFCARAYNATGNTTYKDQAKWHFDQVYSRAWDTSLGGGLWWTTDKNEKNACINGPASIAAYLIYKIFNDGGYLTKAKDIYAWEKSKLFVTSTGRVNDHIKKDGTVVDWSFTYNQGTFIGAASYLFKETGTTSYKDDAIKAMDYTKSNLTTSGSILKLEGSLGGDSGGFKNVFCRWAYRFTKDNNISSYNTWFQDNANTVWGNRNSSNLMGTDWASATGSGELFSFDCSSAVSMMQNCPPGGQSITQATFFGDANYGGNAKSVGKGNYDYNAMINAGISNDWMSSLKVPSDWTVEVYQHGDFSGTKWIFTSDTPWVGSDCNDQMSSFKIY